MTQEAFTLYIFTPVMFRYNLISYYCRASVFPLVRNFHIRRGFQQKIMCSFTKWWHWWQTGTAANLSHGGIAALVTDLNTVTE